MTQLPLALSPIVRKHRIWTTGEDQFFLVDFPGIHRLTFFSWHVVVVYLAVVIVLAQIVYYNNRNSVYRYYQLYAALLLVFILTRNAYWVEFHEWYGNSPIRKFGYLSQIWYLCVYFRFGILFLKLDKHQPLFTARIFSYTTITSLISTVFYGLIFAGLLPDTLGRVFFHYLFLPVHVSLAGIIIYQSAKSPEPYMGYFLRGSFFYIVFALISTLAVAYPMLFDWFGLQPIVYFFIAIVAECTLFAIGLGKQIRDSLREKYELQNLLRETEREMEIRTVRGQLNSHFIFNVLNSIKAFIVEKQIDEATDYLGKFSRFMRRVLEGSNRETNTLRTELKTVRLYADIENMRLSNVIEIKTAIDDRIDPDSIYLPAMILQPFVENAIWHGLNKSANPKKTLLLHVEKQDTGARIIIEDNGVGYSNTLTSGTKVFAKSYGLHIVREQIRQFNIGNGPRLDFEINDRDDGGTRVVFTIAENPQV